MSRLVLVHWHETEGEERAERLRRQGHGVQLHWQQEQGSALTRMLKAAPPDALVIDLARLPAHGREVATWLRGRKATRHVPLVFVPKDATEADKAKTARAKAAFPDAVFAPWSRIKGAITRALRSAPKDPVVPVQAMAGYSGTPLPKKLGVREQSRLGLVRAPKGFRDTLGDLPAGARLTSRLTGEFGVLVLFCRALTELRADWPRAVERLATGGSLWIAWPKKASGMLTDLDGGVVRAFGLDQGLVDTKVCAIDEVWSGLRFQRRRAR